MRHNHHNSFTYTPKHTHTLSIFVAGSDKYLDARCFDNARPVTPYFYFSPLALADPTSCTPHPNEATFGLLPATHFLSPASRIFAQRRPTTQPTSTSQLWVWTVHSPSCSPRGSPAANCVREQALPLQFSPIHSNSLRFYSPAPPSRGQTGKRRIFPAPQPLPLSPPV